MNRYTNQQDELERAKSHYENLRSNHNEVVKKIKEDLEDNYSRNDDKFRHALFLFFGEYREKYSLNSLPYYLNLSIAKSWVKGASFVNKDYYNLYRESHFDSNKLVGFMCEKKYLYEALEYKLKNLWKFYVKEHNYTESLETFKVNSKNKKLDLLEIFRDFNIDNKSTFSIIHKPSLKVNNIVLYINN